MRPSHRATPRLYSSRKTELTPFFPEDLENKRMKVLLVVILDIIMHIIFWMGLSIVAVCLWQGQLSSLGRALEILTGRIESMSPVVGCRGSVAAPALMAVKYRIYIVFPDSRLNQDDKEYFDARSDDLRTGFFWETLGAKLRVTILGVDGRVALPTVDFVPYSQFMKGPASTGQSIDVLDNSRLRMHGITIQHSIETNCEKLLSYHPQIRLLALEKNELMLTRLGMILLGVSCPWVVGKRLRRRTRRIN